MTNPESTGHVSYLPWSISSDNDSPRRDLENEDTRILIANGQKGGRWVGEKEKPASSERSARAPSLLAMRERSSLAIATALSQRGASVDLFYG